MHSFYNAQKQQQTNKRQQTKRCLLAGVLHLLLLSRKWDETKISK